MFKDTDKLPIYVFISKIILYIKSNNLLYLVNQRNVDIL